MKARHKRLILIGIGLAMLGLGAWLILSAFKENMVFFYTPSQILEGKAPRAKNFRLGGMVEKGSLVRQPDGVTVSFVVTDLAQKIKVTYRGILPDLFREGKGVVAQGKLGDGQHFIASEVLAKHDENYMPPEAAYALKKGKEANDFSAANSDKARTNAAASAPTSAPTSAPASTPASNAASSQNKDAK